MIYWENWRPIIKAYSLKPIVEVCFGDFVRLKEIDKTFKLWDDNKFPISINDVSQGYTLGNCYFIAALSALADKPDLIKGLFNFPTKEDEGLISDAGIFSVNVFIRGVPKNILIDDIMPITS
jgi:hypothetical protein